MDNLLALGRRYSFIGLAIGLIVLIMYCLEYKEGRSRKQEARAQEERSSPQKEGAHPRETVPHSDRHHHAVFPVDRRAVYRRLY